MSIEGLDTIPAKSLASRILKTELINWKDLQYIQQEDFKTWSEESRERLINSIMENGFVAPFYVWQDKSDYAIYCMDGRHRSFSLEELIKRGVQVPDLLPATFIHCVDKQEAAKLVLGYSSIYARVSSTGMFDFLQLYDLEFSDIRTFVDIPEFVPDRFEQQFDMYGINNSGEEEPEVELPESKIVVKPGDIFEINGHRIACGSFKDEELIGNVMGNKRARILQTDPPYNLSSDFIVINNDSKKSPKRHEDFAMAAGEMSDIEFVDFLKEVMQVAVAHSLPGAIHFIFMDWRHSWHITMAAKDVYGSPIPKQLCVWNKDTMALGSFYRSKHEFVFIFKSGDKKHVSHVDLKDRIRSNVWDYPSANSTANKDKAILKDHPTPKPVTLIADSILDTTNAGDVILDLFLGSGTSILAADKTKRFCYGTEIEPKHLQQSIVRYINYCEKIGKQVKFIHENGKLNLNSFAHDLVN